MTDGDRKKLTELVNSMSDAHRKQSEHLMCIMVGKPSNAEPWIVSAVNNELSRVGLGHLMVSEDLIP